MDDPAIQKSDQEPVRESVRLLIGAWSTMIPRLPTGRVEELDGVTAAFGHVPLAFFNVAIIHGPCGAGALRDRLAAAKAYAAAGPHPWFAAVCEDLVPDDWRPLCAEAGLYPAVPLAGMVADELPPPRRPPPALGYRRVDDAWARRQMAEINADAYDMPRESFGSLHDEALWKDFFGYVGCVDDEPVCCSTAFDVDGLAYVAMVATRPGHGGRGYAAAVLRHSVEQASRTLGLERTALHATEAGRPVYAGMGYREVTRFVLLSPDPPPA